MVSKAILRSDIGLYIGVILPPLLESYCRIYVLWVQCCPLGPWQINRATQERAVIGIQCIYDLSMFLIKRWKRTRLEAFWSDHLHAWDLSECKVLRLSRQPAEDAGIRPQEELG